MEYSLDQLILMREKVEELGGAMLPDHCSGESIEYPSPGTDKTTKAQTQGCGEVTMMVMPYDVGNDVHFLRACLVCDDVGKWPEFRHITKTFKEK